MTLPTIYIFNIEINILAQIFGLIGLVFVVIAYQKKEKIDFLRFCNYQFFFTMIESILLLAITGLIKIVVGIIRNYFVIYFIKKQKEMPKFLNIIFVLLVAIIGLFFVDKWFSILPIIASIISTVVTCSKNFKLLKIGGIFVQILSMIYNIFVGAFVGFFRQTIILIAIIVGFVNYIKYEKNKYYKIG